jgi:hypothetical protein
MKTSRPASRLYVLLPALATLLCLMPRPSLAQAVSGTVLGQVKDASGAVIPGATVTLVNQGTAFTRTVVSDSKGEFTAPLLPTGTYSATAELTGFKKVSLANVHVGVDQKVRVDVQLEVGDMTEAVEIQAQIPLIQTSSSDMGATVEEQQIKLLPLNGRNFVSLTRTVPGVLRGIPGANIDGAGTLAWRASASFSANGQKPRDNNFLLDGVDNNETWLQTVVIFPSVDALDEFKLQTSTYSAEFGKSLGGVVNIQFKSGSNDFHGSAFEFHRNDRFDANNFFNNRAKRPRPEFTQNQFGATLGGPVVKDRTFFFADYQGLRTTAGQTYLSTVPSEKMRQGDFSEVNRPIYDPRTGLPFPGNIIPVDRWDPAAKAILEQLYPAPNTVGTRGSNGQPINNYLINPSTERKDNQFDIKIDHQVNANNHAFLRYSYERTNRDLPATLPHGDAGFTFGAGVGNIKAQGMAFNDTHTFSASLINEFRLGWGYVDFFMTPIDYQANPASKVGIPGINLNDATSAMTQIVFTNGGARNLGSNGNQPLITNERNLQFFDSVTRVAGRHTMKIGGSLTLRSREILNADSITGIFRFNQNLTSNCAGITSGCTVNPNTGFDIASFLLGYASAKERNLFDAKTYTEKRPEWALYVQDDFRVTSKLTLNMGLRWDLFVPWVEVDNRQSNFDTSTGKFVVASDDAVLNGVKVGRYLQTYSKRDIGPRFGFAYDISGSGKTVVRGGVGVFWNFTPGGTSSSKAQNPPFLQSTALTATGSFGTNLRLSEGLPAPPGVDPNRPAAGSTRSVFDVDFRDGYAVNYNVNVQQELSRNYMVELAYVGSKGRQLPVKLDPNIAPATIGVTNSNVNRPFNKIAPALGDLGQLASIGTLDYNALQIKFVRRFANGFSFLNSYTWGKAIDLVSDNDGNVTLTNPYNPQYNRGPADYDVTHTISSNFIYALPFLKDSKLGGWQLSGIGYFRTGLPFTVTQTQGILSTGNGIVGALLPNRPDRIGSGTLDKPTIDKWFDPSAFVVTKDNTGTYGSSGRNILRGPKQFNIDVSLIKMTTFGKISSELRVDAFNVLNHPQFALPTGGALQIGSASVGQITAMLQNPSCALCGTTERQIQFSMKLKF